ncbi:MAG TPA: ABC transporter ATP-binding protein [Candidatus Limnocylindrales bacterium]|jgi:ABC-2 type transport system ATP-binding protein
MTPELASGLLAIRTRGLSKRYGPVVALDGLDLDVPSGTVFGLLGPNGAGKTTTIRLLAGLAQPTAGSATVNGIDITAGNGDALRRRIGVLDQDPRFYGWMTGRELLEFVGRLFGITGTALRARVGETLELIGLSDAANRRIGGYSGGMRQRLGIGQALVGRPAILILDEPVSSLDPEGRRDLLALIAELRSNATVVLSTHVLADVERICDRVAILDYGRLVTESPTADLLSRYAPPVYRLEPEPGQESPVARLVERLRAAAWSRGVTIEADRILVYVSDPERAGREILAIVTDCDVRLSSFERLRPTLEDVFLRLVGRERDRAIDS